MNIRFHATRGCIAHFAVARGGNPWIAGFPTIHSRWRLID
jgi:hypothetical protein